MTPLLLTGIRFTIAGIILFIIARLRGEKVPQSRRMLLEVFLVGVLLVCIGNCAVVWAEQWVPSGLAALLVATAPFWMAILDRRDRIERRRIVGMLVGFAGVAMLVTPAGAGGAFNRQFVLGALGIQAGAIAWQYGTVRAKYNVRGIAPLMSSALQMLSGGIAVGLIGLGIGETRRFAVTSETLMALAYLTVFGSVLAYTSYVYALAHMNPTKMSMYAYINPVIAVIAGALILNEQLTWISILATCVILAGVAIVQTSRLRETECVPAS